MNAWHLAQAARQVKRGGIVAHPTEAVWGLACDPASETAVRRILELKRRPIRMGLILIAERYEQLLTWIEPLPAARMREIFATWPGPVTWILPARAGAPRWLTGAHAGLAVRVSAHPIAAALCAASGRALVSTSANPHGGAPACRALDVQRHFHGRLDYILPGALGGRARCSEIRDGATGAILRPG